MYKYHRNRRNCHTFDNICDYGDTCTFFISLIIKGGVVNTPFDRYASSWLKIIILRDGEHYLYIKLTPNLFF